MDIQKNTLNYEDYYSLRESVDWNNFNGHVVAGGFVYSKKEKKFLVLYHKDLKMFLYPGGHVTSNDKDPLCAAIREIKEETGLNNFVQVCISQNKLVPLDIDTQLIGFNQRLNLPEHYHFDFRYLFVIDEISDIEIDAEELSNYKWIDIDELSNNSKYGWMIEKINNALSKIN